jgi:hypothetical protein
MNILNLLLVQVPFTAGARIPGIASNQLSYDSQARSKGLKYGHRNIRALNPAMYPRRSTLMMAALESVNVTLNSDDPAGTTLASSTEVCYFRLRSNMPS